MMRAGDSLECALGHDVHLSTPRVDALARLAYMPRWYQFVKAVERWQAMNLYGVNRRVSWTPCSDAHLRSIEEKVRGA
jgi:hypothetical protein